jgi:hypothetical protein
MLEALKKGPFRAIPGVPAANKWTKLGPTVDMLVMGMLCHGIFTKAFLAMRLRHQGGAIEGLDPQLMHDACWAEVQGRRYTDSCRFLLDACTRARLCMLSLVLEPIRLLTSWWMRRCREVDEHRVGLVDMVYAPRSPLTVAMQHVSTLLFGQSSRIVLLQRSAGKDTLQQWFAECGWEVREFRRLLLVTAAAIYRRHILMYEQFPWQLVILCDEKIPVAARTAIAEQWDRLAESHCCCPAGFARRLRQRGATGHQLMHEEKWQRALYWFAKLTVMSICDVEWRHNRARKKLHKDGHTRWPAFVADTLNGEVEHGTKKPSCPVKCCSQGVGVEGRNIGLGSGLGLESWVVVWRTFLQVVFADNIF